MILTGDDPFEEEEGFAAASAAEEQDVVVDVGDGVDAVELRIDGGEGARRVRGGPEAASGTSVELAVAQSPGGRHEVEVRSDDGGWSDDDVVLRTGTGGTADRCCVGEAPFAEEFRRAGGAGLTLTLFENGDGVVEFTIIAVGDGIKDPLEHAGVSFVLSHLPTR